MASRDILAILASGVDFDPKLAAITEVAREAVARTGYVPDAVWQAALDAGWTDEELAEAFASLGTHPFEVVLAVYAEAAGGVGRVWNQPGVVVMPDGRLGQPCPFC